MGRIWEEQIYLSGRQEISGRVSTRKMSNGEVSQGSCYNCPMEFCCEYNNTYIIYNINHSVYKLAISVSLSSIELVVVTSTTTLK